MYCGINGWAYFREKSTLCNNFIQKRGVGVFSRVGLFSGDYGNMSQIPSFVPLVASLEMVEDEKTWVLTLSFEIGTKE